LTPGGSKVHEDNRRAAVSPEKPLGHPQPSSRVRMMGLPERTTSIRTDDTGDELLYAETMNTPSDFFVAELSRAPNDQFLVIDGVHTDDLKRYRTLWTLVCILVLFVVITLAAGLITRRITSSTSRSPNPSNATMDPSTPLVPVETLVPAQAPRLNLTIADSLKIGGRNKGFTIVDMFAGQIFLETVNRTDTNFTFFGITRGAKIFEGVDPSLLGKITSPSWSGHIVSALLLTCFAHVLANPLNTNSMMLPTTIYVWQLNGIEGYAVEGQAVAVEDMYDGMILQSISGYPLVIQLDPIRVNNTPIVMEERDAMYKNGITHGLTKYFSPIVPWIGKSKMDVLLVTNDQRNRDLSAFIAMIDASPDLKALLHEGQSTGTTLFVPTNQALTNVNLSLMANATMVMQLLRNHIVSGNFVRRCWESIPTGTKLSDTELILDSQAGYELHLNIDDVVTINGAATIVQEDIFSGLGIIHVIDKALLVDYQ
jgi:uncharacterized surface protein with fasciclin (FAS1) repeats